MSRNVTQLGSAQRAKPGVITAVPLGADQCDALPQTDILQEAVQMATSYASLLSRGHLSVNSTPQQLRAKLQVHLGVLHTKYIATSVEERAEADDGQCDVAPTDLRCPRGILKSVEEYHDMWSSGVRVVTRPLAVLDTVPNKESRSLP